MPLPFSDNEIAEAISFTRQKPAKTGLAPVQDEIAEAIAFVRGVSVRKASKVDDESWNITRGLKSGLWSTAAVAPAVGAMAAKTLGWQGGAKAMSDAAQDLMKRAEQYQPDTSFGELIEDPSLGGAVDWALFTIGNFAPSMMVGFGGAGVGAKVATKLYLKNAIKRGIARGLSKEAAAKAVTKDVMRKVALRGAQVGIVGSTGQLEGGHMFMGDVERHGIEDASVGKAVALGGLAGLVELGIGGFGKGHMRLIEKYLGKAAKREAIKQPRLAIRMLDEIGKQSGGEAFQELTQEELAILHEAWTATPEEFTQHDHWSKENWLRRFEAGAGGALIGIPGGMVTPAITRKTPAPSPPPTISEEARAGLNAADTLTNIKAALESDEITTDDVMNYARSPEAQEEGIVDGLNALIIEAKAKEELAPAAEPVPLEEGIALTDEEILAERAKTFEEAPRKPAEISAEAFEKDITEEERVRGRAEIEPDLNKFFKRAKEIPITPKQKDLLRGLTKEQAQKIAVQWNEIWKAGTETAKQARITEAETFVRERPDLFNLVHGLLTVEPTPAKPTAEVVREGVEKKQVEFIGMQERLNKPPLPLVNELDTKSTVAYDPAKHELTNLTEYEKAVAGEKGEKIYKQQTTVKAIEQLRKGELGGRRGIVSASKSPIDSPDVEGNIRIVFKDKGQFERREEYFEFEDEVISKKPVKFVPDDIIEFQVKDPKTAERFKGFLPEEYKNIPINSWEKGLVGRGKGVKAAKSHPSKIEKPTPKLPRTEEIEDEGIPEVKPKTVPGGLGGRFLTKAETKEASDFVLSSQKLKKEAQDNGIKRLAELSEKELKDMDIDLLDSLLADITMGPGNLQTTMNWEKDSFVEALMKKKAKAIPEAKAKPEKEKVEALFIRKPTVKEKKGGKPRSDGFLKIPDKEGYEKVYKPYGEEGAGYYYRPVAEKEKVEVTAEKKEPWEMSENEYVQSSLEDLKGKIKLTGQAKNLYLMEWKDKFTVTHQRSVEKAIQEGKLPKPGKQKVEVETTLEGKEISVDLTKKEEAAVTPKQQKEYLLAEIDKAIEEAPDIEFEHLDFPVIPWRDDKANIELYEKEKRKVLDEMEKRQDEHGTVTIRVPGDGVFTILNTKQALQDFKKKAKKFPSTLPKSKVAIPGVIRKTPLKEDIGEIKTKAGAEYFTDGHLIIKGKPPARAKYSKGDYPQKNVKEFLETTTEPAKLKYYAFQNPDVGEGVAGTPIPSVLIDKTYHGFAVFQAKDGELFNYDQLKFNAITKRFPKAKYGISKEEWKEGLLIAYENKKSVAGLMPVKIVDVEGGVMEGMATKQGFIKGKLEKPAGVSEKQKIEYIPSKEKHIKRYVPITRKEADDLFDKGAASLVARFNVRGPETTGEEGYYMRSPDRKAAGYSYSKEVIDLYEKYKERHGSAESGVSITSGKTKQRDGRLSAKVRDEKAFATKAIKPQETITRKDLRRIFKRMKNIRTGQDKDGNLWFKAEGRPQITIFELDNITGHLNTSAGQIPVGSFLKNTIELKTGGKGYTADVGTAFHEFEHWMEANGILSNNDIKALDVALEKQGIAPNTETRAEYVGDRLSEWQGQKNLRIRRVLKKIADFVNSIWEFVSRTRTARGVLADIESGTILKEKSEQAKSLILDKGIPVFQAKRGFTYLINCVGSTAEKIDSMVDQAREISYDTFIKHVSVKELEGMFDFYEWGAGKKEGLRLKDDYAVSYHRSKYEGKPAYYIDHSAIEYIFADTEAGKQFQMAGEKAIDAPTGQLVKAQEMLAEDKNKKEVWRETGWLFSKEGKWKWEIDDSGAKLSTPALTKAIAPIIEEESEMGVGRLEELLKHDDLYKAYPQLKDTRVIFHKQIARLPRSAEWLQFLTDKPSEIHVYQGASIESMAALKSTLLHEIQHGIQYIENFAKGGSPQYGGIAPLEVYRRTAGEIEARDTSARALLSPKHRKEIFPYEAQGIPEDQWIITEGKGTSFNVESKKRKPSREDLSKQTGSTLDNEGMELNYIVHIDRHYGTDKDGKYKLIPDKIYYDDVGLNLQSDTLKGLKDKITKVKSTEQKAFSVKGGKDYSAMFEKYRVKHTTPLVDEIVDETKIKHFHNLGKTISQPTWIKDKFGREEKTLKEKIGDNVGAFRKNWQTRLLDRLHPIKALGETAYMLHRLETGAQATMAMFMRHGKLRWEGKGLIIDTQKQGFMPWLDSLGGDAQKLFYWMAAKRAEVLETEGREKWLDADTRKKIFDWVGDKPESAKSWRILNNQFQGFNKSVLDLAQQSGLINPIKRAAWEQEFYVPFYRIFEDAVAREEFLKGPMMGKKHISAQIKRLLGAEMKIGDPLENVIRNWSHLIHESVRNMARAEAYDYAQKNKIKSSIMGEGDKLMPLIETVKASELNIYRSDKEKRMVYVTKKGDDNILSFQKNGRRVYFKVNDAEMFNALSDVNHRQFNGFLVRACGQAKRWLTYGATFGPAFKVANMLRDSLHTAIISKSFIPFVDSGKGIIKALREDADYVKFMASGAGFGSSYIRAENPQALAEYINRIVKKEGKGSVQRILDTPKKMLDFWEKLGAASENAARVQLYTKRIAEGETHLKAAFEGRDLMDFTMRGDSQVVQFLIRTIPFMNARAQGLYKLGRAAKQDPKSFLIKGSMLTMASLALWAINRDEDEWKELEDWDKRTYYHFWIGDKHYRIPKPFETGAIFSTMFEGMAEVMSGDEEFGYFVDVMKDTFLDTFAMNPIPQAVRPLIEQWSNKSFFTGRPIEGQSLQRLRPGERKTAWTSETMQLAGKLGVSPKRAEEIIRGYFSTFGMFLLGISDIFAYHLADFPINPTKEIDDYPLLGRFIKERTPARHTKYQTEFYEIFREVDQLVATINNHRRLGNYKKAAALATKERKKIAKRGRLVADRKQLIDINANLRRITSHRILTAEQKRARIDQLVKRKNRITKRAYEIYAKD